MSISYTATMSINYTTTDVSPNPNHIPYFIVTNVSKETP